MAMMPEMTDEDFDKKGGNYFDAGVHEVVIEKASRGKSQNTGTPFIGVTVQGKNGESTDVRLYLSDAAAPRTRQILASIAVHNKDSEKEKQAVRDVFKKITNTDTFDDTFLKKFVDMQAWILTEEDTSAPKPNGGYYLRSNLYSYEPTPRKQTNEVQTMLDNSSPEADVKIPF